MGEGQGLSAYWLGRGESSYQRSKKTLLFAINNLKIWNLTVSWQLFFFPPELQIFFFDTKHSLPPEQICLISKGGGRDYYFLPFPDAPTLCDSLKCVFLVQASRASQERRNPPSFIHKSLITSLHQRPQIPFPTATWAPHQSAAMDFAADDEGSYASLSVLKRLYQNVGAGFHYEC